LSPQFDMKVDIRQIAWHEKEDEEIH